MEKNHFKRNLFIEYRDYYEMVIYSPKYKEIYKTKIDKKDYAKVSKYTWNIEKKPNQMRNFYVACGHLRMYLHQFLMGKKQGFVIDHIDRDILNNRRYNLRFATLIQNARNRTIKSKSGISGINWEKSSNKWKVSIYLFFRLRNYFIPPIYINYILYII